MATAQEASTNDSFGRDHPLLIYDILDIIFAYSTPSTNAAWVRVSPKWSELATDHLFTSLPSLFPLLRKLLPLVIVDGARDFDYDARTPNWERFWALCARVRTLKHDDNERPGSFDSLLDVKGRIAPGLIPYLLLNQSWKGSGRFLLPNLRDLEWMVHWPQSLFQLPYLTSPSLRNLVINLRASSLPSAPTMRCFKVLATLPGLDLRTLRLTTAYTDRYQDLELEPAVASFVESQQALSTLDLAWVYSRNEIIQGLYQHPKLASLELLLPFESYDSVQTSLQSLAEHCPIIETLKLFCPKNFLQPMTCDVIQPLFRCNRLRELQVCYGGDFRVDSESVQSMGEAWSDLEILNLCAGAKSSHWDGAPLTLLQEFAAEFGHKLRRLALNFAYTQELPTADTVSTSFSQLEILGVGKTKIDSVDHFGVLAEFLVSVCSKETEIAYISKDFWRADAFQTTGWENAPEAKNWVAVKQNMECMRRLQRAVHRERDASATQ